VQSFSPVANEYHSLQTKLRGIIEDNKMGAILSKFRSGRPSPLPQQLSVAPLNEQSSCTFGRRNELLAQSFDRGRYSRNYLIQSLDEALPARVH